MHIIPWNKQRDLPTARGDLDDFWRVFDGPRHLPEVFRNTNFPKVNVAETESALEITAELPGMDEEDIDVQIMGNLLVISGERKWEDEKKSKELHRMESEFGSFRREIPLPDGLLLDADHIAAKYKKGVLKVSAPKVKPTPASKIKVKAE